MNILMLTVFTWLTYADTANIIVIYPVQVKSHFFFLEAILKNLIQAGHHVTLIAPFNLSKPLKNFTFIDSDTTNTKQTFSNYDFKSMTRFEYVRFVSNIFEGYCYDFVKLQKVQNIVNTGKKKFDVLFLSVGMLHECFIPVAKTLDIPVIGIISLRSLLQADNIMGNPRNPAVFPSEMINVQLSGTFYERLLNTMNDIGTSLLNHFIVSWILDKFVSQHYTTYDWRKDGSNISLLFYNSHSSILPRPLVPNVIEIGGIHISSSTNPLPQNILEFIENSQHGVILFTFGSTTKSFTVSVEMRKIFRDVFAKIPQRVIWKFEEEIENLSENVLRLKWIPQRDILAHKNVKAFITHCGIAGMYEAIYEAVPLVMIPLFVDQPGNAALMKQRGVGVYLDFRSLTKEKLIDAINSVINDTSYKEKMMELSRRYKDRPMTPQQTLIYWTEYIIKHKGAPHLKTVGADMPLYQYLLLDILLFVLLIIAIIISVIYYILKKISNIRIRKCTSISVETTNKRKTD